MSDARWEKVARLFEEALERRAGERGRYLDAHCRDPAVRREVEAMLRGHERAEGILERSLAEVAGVAGVGESEPVRVPEWAGPYHILEEIGRGGMGVVFRAHDPRLDRLVAVKVLPGTSADGERFRSRVLAEARAASALDHPNVCTVHDVGETAEGLAFIVMAFYPGKTLAVRLAEGRLEALQALDVAEQVAHGLQHAHGNGIVHRDVKPSNLLITDRGDVKILDFGIAQSRGVLAVPQRVGTAAYMSPEQLRGEPLDPRTDLWSLGVVLYEMLTGRRPFEAGGDPATLVRGILEDPPPPLPDSPPAVESLLRRLLAKERGDRCPSAEELVAELSRLRQTASPRPEELLAGTATGEAAPGGLPQPLTSFVGREQEIEEVGRQLETARLVTLVGPGGTGKSRLAMEVASRLSDRFADGTSFVPLAPIRDPALLPAAIGEAVGLEPAAARGVEELASALGRQARLLVLDNFEQLASGAPLLARLLEGSPGIRALVTSRVRLRLAGEHTVEVAPLPVLPAAEATAARVESSPATRLFLERARSAEPGLVVESDVEAAVVAEVCARLEGLPLAIELAAARVRLFPLPALLQRLERRLEVLAGGARNRPERHQTLRRALAWSYDLLSPDLQAFFRRMGVFEGGARLAVAGHLAAAVGPLQVEPLEAISELLDHSLLRRLPGNPSEPRVGMLETVREMAREELVETGEEETARGAHAAWCLELAERAGAELTGASQAQWLERLEEEQDNVRAAFRWVVEGGDADTGLRLGAAFWRFWLVRGRLEEARSWLERVLALQGGPEEARAAVLQALGTVEHNLGHNRTAETLLTQALALRRRRGDLRGAAVSLTALGWVACELSELDEAERLSEEARALTREQSDLRSEALAVNNLAWVAGYRGDPRRGRELFAESLRLRRESGDRRGVAFELVGLAWMALLGGRYDEAGSFLDEAIAELRSLGDRLLSVAALTIRAAVAHDRGDLERAGRLIEEALEGQRKAPNASLEAWALSVAGAIERDRGRLDTARRRLERSLAIWESIEGVWGAAVAQARLATVDAAEGRSSVARERFHAAMRRQWEVGDRLGMATTLEGLGRLDAEVDPERSAVLLGAARAIRLELGAPLAARRRSEEGAWIARLREVLGEAGFEEAWRRGGELGWEGAAARELGGG